MRYAQLEVSGTYPQVRHMRYIAGTSGFGVRSMTALFDNHSGYYTLQAATGVPESGFSQDLHATSLFPL